jgi:outer membrane receptor for ferrienterochelin and colicin
MSWLRKLAAGAAVSVMASAIVAPAMAQETTSSVRGGVASTTGSPVDLAEVTIVHEPTGAVSTEFTNADGLFNVAGLRVGGPYTITVTAPDFRGQRYDNVFLSVGEPLRLTATLEPAPQGDVIVVTAARRSAIESVGSATTLGRDAIDGIVSVNRDIRDLTRRDPLVTQNNRGDGGISIAGSNPRTNRITVGGVQSQDDFGLNTGGFPTRRGPVSLDAISELAVEAVPFDVENGDFTGGAINIILQGGTNDFGGSVFANYLNDGFVGTRIAGTEVRIPRTQENWGATLRGPIVPGSLFFSLSYETYTSIDGTDRGPAGENYATGFAGLTGAANTLTRSDINAVTNVFRNTYGSTFAFGDITPSKPVTDEKYSAQLDWDITNDHRASFVVRSAESGLIQRTNLAATSAGLDSQWYLTGEEDLTYSAQLNSDWTNNFSTELRWSRRDYERAQMPPSGQAFADVSVCASPTAADGTLGTQPFQNCRATGGTTGVSVIRFGPDQFRHANELATTNDQIQLSGEYELGSHLIKFGGQWQRTGVENLFVEQSDGVYYFDSIADFTAGRAGQLLYNNAITNNPQDAVAEFSYDVLSIFLQDSWDITERLSINYGLRYDTYVVDGEPARNPNFINRYGFDNQETYDGRDVLMPRFSFEYDPTENLEISGGVGLFSGGVPDVFISNSFSNTGILTNSLTFQRTPTSQNATSFNSGAGWFTETSGAVNCLATPAICQAALNVPVNSSFGTTVPASVQAALGGTTASPTAITNSIAPDFEMPSEWKANLSFQFNIGGWDLGADIVGTMAQEEIAFRDLRARPLIINGAQARTPDGRLRYDALSAASRTAAAGAGLTVNSTSETGANRDIQLYNPDAESAALTAAFSVAREWDNGLSMFAAYTYQDSEGLTASTRFSSTASSLYGGMFSSTDPNNPTLGRSFDEIEHSARLGLTWRREFVRGLETRFDLFGETRNGRTSSFVMNAGGNRNANLGVNKGGQLAYIPNLSNLATTAVAGGLTIASDSLVVFDNQTSINNLVTAVNRFGLDQGRISQVGEFTNRGVDRLDLNISQQLPAFFEGNRTLLTFQFQNVLNMLNDDWGRVEELGDTQTLYSAACADAAGNTTALATAQCTRWRISNVTTVFTPNRNVDQSLWQLQIGLRYEW